MKKSLIEIVQNILSDMDSEEVNSIGDSVEAMQVATIVETTFHNIIATRLVPEHKELIKLTAMSDSDYPTHFKYPDKVKETEKIWYADSEGNYKEVTWSDPLDFLNATDCRRADYVEVLDKNAGTTLRILTTKDPEYFTSFDDEYIVMDSYDSAVDSTLQASKVRAYGTKYPTFELTDNYTPDLDDTMFPYLLAEAKSTAMSLLKGGSDAKVEQAARRHKSYVQNDLYKTKRKRGLSTYGR